MCFQTEFELLMNMAYELEITSVTAWVQIMGAHLVPLAEDAGDRIYGVGGCKQAVRKRLG